MESADKQTALRMIPYGLFVLTAETEDGRVAAATVNWVTQASFEPPLVAVAVKENSGAHAIIKETGGFALNVLGKDQASTAVTFFKATEKGEGTIGGEPFHRGTTGVPILDTCLAAIECQLIDKLERRGDHALFLARVVNAEVQRRPEGRPDEATLRLPDLGGDIYYGG